MEPAVVDLRDAGMADLTGRTDLGKVARERGSFLGEGWKEDLHRRLLPALPVLAQIDLAHAAFAQLLDEPVAADGFAYHACTLRASLAGLPW